MHFLRKIKYYIIISTTRYEHDKYFNEYMCCVVCEREFCYNCFIYKRYDDNYICKPYCIYLMYEPFACGTLAKSSVRLGIRANANIPRKLISNSDY